MYLVYACNAGTQVQHSAPAPLPGAGEQVTVHDPRLQTMRYGPTGGQTYEQHSAMGQDSDTARVAHLQYCLLYTSDAADE